MYVQNGPLVTSAKVERNQTQCSVAAAGLKAILAAMEPKRSGSQAVARARLGAGGEGRLLCDQNAVVSK
jgi:hypothetical protein